MVDAERELLQTAGHTVVPVDFENSDSSPIAGAQLVASPWNLRSALTMREIAQSTSPTVAHIHNTWFAASPSIIRTLDRSGVPVVMTLHNYRMTCIAATLSRDGRPCELCVGNNPWPGVRYQCYRGSLLASLIATSAQAATGATLEGVDRFVALTPFASDIYVRAGLDPARIEVVPNFTVDPGPRRLPPSASDTILFVGRLAQEKGIDLFLEAWGKAAPPMRLQVIGEGPLASQLKALYPTVEFLGQLSGEEVGQKMLSSRALMFPSQWYEGQSMVVLEAMAAGLPVMASSWPPVGQTLGGLDSDWLVSPHDQEAWANRLQLLEEGSAVDEASSSLRRQYESVHTPAQAVVRLTKLYQGVVT